MVLPHLLAQVRASRAGCSHQVPPARLPMLEELPLLLGLPRLRLQLLQAMTNVSQVVPRLRVRELVFPSVAHVLVQACYHTSILTTVLCKGCEDIDECEFRLLHCKQRWLIEVFGPTL